MEIRQFIVNINSAAPDRLVAFYRDVVGLRPRFDFAAGAFGAGSGAAIAIIVEGHSEVRGETKEPERVLLNFLVDDAVMEHHRLEQEGVRFVRAVYEEPGVGRFATFVDPDGNYCQLVELRN